MTSGKMTKKPDDLARERIANRTRKMLILSGKKIGKLKDGDKKTPSEKHSASGRSRYLKKAISEGRITSKPNPDCWECEKRPTCTATADNPESGCTMPTVIQRCHTCEFPWVHPIISRKEWKYCPRCRRG